MKRIKRTREISDYLRILIHQRSTPHAVALGACIGLFIALSPLYGFQMVSAFLLAGLLRASRMAAVYPVVVWGVSRVRLSRGIRLRRIGMIKRGRGMADES